MGKMKTESFQIQDNQMQSKKILLVNILLLVCIAFVLVLIYISFQSLIIK